MTYTLLNPIKDELSSKKRSSCVGLLPYQELERFRQDGVVKASQGVAEIQLQPASLDVRLGSKAHRVRAGFLPGARSVQKALKDMSLHSFSLEDGAVLETGCVYVVEVAESLALPSDVWALANPKSSIGRLDVFTRLISDYGAEYDRLPAGYNGPLFLEVSPRTFNILVRAGSRLAQIRFLRGPMQPLQGKGLQSLNRKRRLVEGAVVNISGGLALSVDLKRDGLVGYRARRYTGVIDVDKCGFYDPEDFWDQVLSPKEGRLALDPGEFYILISQEKVSIPSDYAAEMRPYDAFVGAFRAHYAGFFDPGFGAQGRPARAVLEVRSHDVPFFLEHGQVVGRLLFEPMTEEPTVLYGSDKVRSSYQGQDLKLSRQFKEP